MYRETMAERGLIEQTKARAVIFDGYDEVEINYEIDEGRPVMLGGNVFSLESANKYKRVIEVK